MKFCDSEGNSIDLNGSGLLNLESIDISGLDIRVMEITFNIICDVDNSLFGLKGAAYAAAGLYGTSSCAAEHYSRKYDKIISSWTH